MIEIYFLKGGLKTALSNVAPGADDVRPNVDMHDERIMPGERFQNLIFLTFSNFVLDNKLIVMLRVLIL